MERIAFNGQPNHVVDWDREAVRPPVPRRVVAPDSESNAFHWLCERGSSACLGDKRALGVEHRRKTRGLCAQTRLPLRRPQLHPLCARPFT